MLTLKIYVMHVYGGTYDLRSPLRPRLLHSTVIISRSLAILFSLSRQLTMLIMLKTNQTPDHLFVVSEHTTVNTQCVLDGASDVSNKASIQESIY